MKTAFLRYACCVVALLGLGGNFVSAILVDATGISYLSLLDLRFEATRARATVSPERISVL